jgi:DNA-binding protein H-NS
LQELLEGAPKGKAPAAPKYRHPENPELTWSGRGRKPKWFVAALEQGKTPEEMLI